MLACATTRTHSVSPFCQHSLLVKKSEFRCISLLLMAVAASFCSVSLWLLSPMSTAISLILLTAMPHARRRPLMMVWLLTPCSTYSLTSLSTSPASTTTDVVPSPTSASCERAMSVRMRAAGWTMSRSCAQSVLLFLFQARRHSGFRLTFITVAPSLVIVCLPFSSTSSRSPPYGPKVLLMVDCTAKQALMLDNIWPLPCD